MKNITYICAFVLALFATSCSDDEDNIDFINDVNPPSNISALFTITQDNSGLVTIAPKGEGVGTYMVDFGDGTSDAAEVAVGNSVEHSYTEGVYDVTITGVGVTGKTTSTVMPLTVSFIAPENFMVNIAQTTGDTFSIDVSASADYETYFAVWFGDVEDEEPTAFMEGETITHTYAAVGTYTVTVVAYSGGAATVSYTQEVVIANPLLLPITFENTTLSYEFSDFGGVASSVVANPDISGINLSATVGQSIKTAGAEVWGGTLLTLGDPIDFSTNQMFRVKTWSPIAGATVKLKVENLADGNIAYEVDQTTTVANEWEYLTFDFSGIDTAQEYSKVVIFFDFGNNGAGDTFYFDDVYLTDGAAPKILPLTFESTTLDYGYGDFGNAYASKVANPDMTGLNTSDNVTKVTKVVGAETWAGTAILLTEPIDFTTYQKVKVKVWSPQAGIPVLFKMENASNSAIATELSVNTTVSNQWEELVFDFTGIDNNNAYQNVVLFFDFGTAGTGTDYYFDDVELTN
ncbi:hypothetical protein SAMN05216480_101566 [Pustulibacterium marinum]|uniref:PKD domain-containing protein n=1 Tax=Pustulibacterium marinum TaxID=1224947 RepID=A0A1I7F2R7_9FLAO|nr:PKD domain-containing protein [Pustulibacterium marinum]SFU30399.1 hypothetical protein SAMN05216480_101566 [Pustulibacterium marinum]